MLLLAGDDHGCKSSTLPHQSEYAFIDASIPVLNPVKPFRPGRFRPAWLGAVAILRRLGGTEDHHGAGRQLGHPRYRSGPSAASACRTIPLFRAYQRRRPQHPLAGPTASIRKGDWLTSWRQSMPTCGRTVSTDFAIDSPRARIGILTTGKAYLDVRQALDDLGIDEAPAPRILGLACLQGRR